MNNKTINKHLDEIHNFKNLVQHFYNTKMIKKNMYKQTFNTINICESIYKDMIKKNNGGKI